MALVGMPGAGKTAAGRLLAERLALPFADADAEVERESGKTVRQIFDRDGEAAFRALERAAIDRLLAGTPLVLATGGGAMAETKTRDLLLERAITIWLDAPVAMLVPRLVGTTHRPLLTGNRAARLAVLKAARDPSYAFAHHRIDASETPQAVVASIIEVLANQNAPPPLRGRGWGEG